VSDQSSFRSRFPSPERFAIYLQACNNDQSRALSLYLWNAELSTALLRDLGHLEIALRNRYNQALQQGRQSTRHWLSDLTAPMFRRLIVRGKDVNARSRTQATEAIQRAGGVGAPAGKIIAELPFGFWCHMTDAARTQALWVPHLRHLFPKGTTRADVSKIVTDLNTIRNRAAHQETLLNFDLAHHYNELLHLAEMLIIELGQLLKSTSNVPQLLADRP
jgi:Abi-like protein